MEEILKELEDLRKDFLNREESYKSEAVNVRDNPFIGTEEASRNIQICLWSKAEAMQEAAMKVAELLNKRRD